MSLEVLCSTQCMVRVLSLQDFNVTHTHTISSCLAVVSGDIPSSAAGVQPLGSPVLWEEAWFDFSPGQTRTFTFLLFNWN